MNVHQMTMKIILLTGATDGIGLETAKMLVSQGHHVILHGRNPKKLHEVESMLSKIGKVETVVSDLSKMADVVKLSKSVLEKHQKLDVLINNAGVFMTSNTRTVDGLDVRFAVNTIAPYLLTKQLLPIMNASSRVINLSSAAQAPVNLDALAGKKQLDDNSAYAQSKLAITMWSRYMAKCQADTGENPIVVSVNPGSFLGSKMVKEAYGMDGKDLSIGADILVSAALSKKFVSKSGEYFDNDSGRFKSPHPDGLSNEKCQKVVEAIEKVLTGLKIQVKTD